MDLSHILDPEALAALGSVVVIDVALAGDNAVVVGMAAAGLPRDQQKRVIAFGIAAATALRIVFALGAVQLLTIVGLTLAGGILLLWVAWKMYRQLQQARMERRTDAVAERPAAAVKTFRQALLQVVIADISMSLDNILAVAGTARDHLWVLIVGLLLSVGLMGAASTVVARLLDRHQWIAWIGLAIVAVVALRMIYDGGYDVVHHM